VGAKWLITIVATVISVLIMAGCATVPTPKSYGAMAQEATLKITITANKDGEISETVVGVIDGVEIPLDPIRVDPNNPIKGLLQHFQGKQVKGGKTDLIVFIGASPGCLCRGPGAEWLCSPPGCN
jgi:hypothetical protein